MKLRKLWRDYNLSLVLLACFLFSWALQAWTGWRKFSAEQLQHQQAPSVFGDTGYIWEFLAATFENWQSEFLQLLAMVVLTSFLIHRGSAESKDSNDRMEATIDDLDKRLRQMAEGGESERSGAAARRTQDHDSRLEAESH
jgi:hypothetical protein